MFMRKNSTIYTGNLIKSGLAATLGLALAYGYHSLAQSSHFSYLEALIAELETNSVQIAPEDSPSVGLFYSAQFGEEWPPLPANIYEVPFWDLGNGVFLMDDRDVNYVELPSSASRSSIVTPPLRSGQTGNGLPWQTNIAVTVVTNSSSTNYITSFDVAGGMTNVTYGLIVATNVISDTQVVLASEPSTNIFPSNVSTNNQTWVTNSIRNIDFSHWNLAALVHSGDHFCFTNSTEQGYYTIIDPSYLFPGSLPYHLATNAVGYASGKTLANNGCLFDNWVETNVNNSNILSQLRWSTNCWLSGVKGLSATSIGSIGKHSGWGLMTMISPIHYLRAWHTTTNYTNFHNYVAFLGTDNQIHWRKPVEQIYIGTGRSDACVGILNEPLPESVGFLPVLPPDLNYLPMKIDNISPTGTNVIQGIGMNQDAIVFSQPINFSTNFVRWNITNSPVLGLSTNWNIEIKTGDSSAPERFLIDNQLVFVTVNTGIGAGTNYQCLHDSINEAMSTLSLNHNQTNYQLTPISLTNYSRVNWLGE